MRSMFAWRAGIVSVLALTFTLATARAQAQTQYPPYATVLKDFSEVTSKDGKGSFYRVWYRSRDAQLFAELPQRYSQQYHFIAMTVASGERFAGLQSGDMYVQWRRYDSR